MQQFFKRFSFLSTVILLCVSGCMSAEEYRVSDQAEYLAIADKLEAGDTVILTNGVWTDFEILLQGQGTKDNPITLTAETKGQVILSGQSNLRLAGEYLVVSGLVFKDGYTPTSAVIEFRQNAQELANHSRVTEVVIDNFNNPDKQESDYWVALYGQYNRLDHNHIVGKRNKGVTVAVRLNSEASQQNHHRIDHNYFGYRPTFGSNGGETLRIGTSHYSLTDSFTVVENNYFEQTNGEVEIISVKSGKNVIRGNVFDRAQGTLTLRHGDGNLIENNVFWGRGVDHTGGIRVINKQQTIRNNYLEGLTGYRFGSGFAVMNGVPNSPINRYHQVEDTNISNNTFVDVANIQFAVGSDSERSAVPITSTFTDNLVVQQNGIQPFTIFDDVSGITFGNNIANTESPEAISNGFQQRAIELQRAENGLLYPVDIEQGVSRDLTVIKREQVGVSWYPKPPAVVAFDSGTTHSVNANVTALQNAIAEANDGDVLILAAGQYVVPKVLYIDKTLTIQAQHPGSVELSYERSALFEIKNGGSLKLSGLNISGKDSPDAHGNSVVRTQKWGMLENYRLVVQDSVIQDLDVNHSFHFFVTGKGAFADQVTLQNNQFAKVSGDVLRLNSEIEDLGIYNAEYVTLVDNQFADIQGAIVKLYRGGTDESTFGPHLAMRGNQLENTGNGKRNKEQSSVYLHGVQVTDIEDNNFQASTPIVIEHTVGEPQSAIIGNAFTATPAPLITELRFPGPHTADVRDNEVQ